MSDNAHGFRDISSAHFNAAKAMLAGIPGGFEKAVNRALTRTSSHVKTVAHSEVRKVYAIRKKELQENETVGIRYSTAEGVTSAEINYRGKKIPLYRFDGASPVLPTPQNVKRRVNIGGRWVWMRPGIPAKAHVLKDSAVTTFDGPRGAFAAKMPNTGHIGFFRRTGRPGYWPQYRTGSDKIKELVGRAVPQMIGRTDVLAGVSGEAKDTFEKRLFHEVEVILNGLDKGAAN